MAVAHVLGGLSESDSRNFRAHLLECTNCRARVGELRSIAHELADVERDEARQRAAQSIETKRREEEGAQEAPRAPRSRLGRVAVALLVAAVMLLAGWNFMLRGTVDSLRTNLDARAEVTRALEFGQAWEVLDVSPGADGRVREHDGGIALIVDGLEDRLHGLYLVDSAGATLTRDPVRPVNGTVFLLIDDPPTTATQLLLTRPEQGMTADPGGRTIFSARAHEPAPSD